MKQLYATRKIFGELQGSDLPPGSLVGIGSPKDLYRVDLVLDSYLNSLSRDIVDTLICTDLAGKQKTLIFDSDFSSEVFLLSTPQNKTPFIKDLLDFNVLERHSGVALPDWLGKNIAPCKTDIPYSYLVDRLRLTSPNARDIVVLLNTTQNQIGFLWAGQGMAASQVGQGWFTGNWFLAIPKKKTSKKPYFYTYGGGSPLTSIYTQMANQLANFLSKDWVVVDFIP